MKSQIARPAGDLQDTRGRAGGSPRSIAIVSLLSRHWLPACRRGGCGFIATITLHRNIEIVAVGIGGTRFRVRPVSRALSGPLDGARHEPMGDLVLVVHLPAEMI